MYGRPVEVDSDHKPLVPIIKKPLVKSPPRVQRLLLTLEKYDISITYVPGKYMYVADTLSRASLNEKSADSELNDDMEVVVHSLVTNLPLTEEKLTQMKSETAQDETLQELLKVVKSGWPSHRSKVRLALANYSLPAFAW